MKNKKKKFKLTKKSFKAKTPWEMKRLGATLTAGATTALTVGAFLKNEIITNIIAIALISGALLTTFYSYVDDDDDKSK